MFHCYRLYIVARLELKSCVSVKLIVVTARVVYVEQGLCNGVVSICLSVPFAHHTPLLLARRA